MTSELPTLLREAKSLAKRYYEFTRRPLGVTGEIGELEAVTALGLTLAEARQEGFDATGVGDKKFQIKTRCVPKANTRGQRMGAIKLDHAWDAVLLVLLNCDYELVEIYEAQRERVVQAISEHGRPDIPVNMFKGFGERRFPAGNESH